MEQARRTYSRFGIRRSITQLSGLVRNDPADASALEGLRTWLDQDVHRIERQLGEELVGKRVLEVGPGQGLERAHYLGLQNSVEVLDSDLVSIGFDPLGWLRMLRVNGPGRVVKSVSREILFASRVRRRWVQMTGADSLIDPTRHQGDICEWPNPGAPFDVVVSWSVFEHLRDPRGALISALRAVRPGGVVMASIHNYTAFNGHHDIRSFSGSGDERLIWGHLRSSTASIVEPSAYLNEWRLSDWRALFAELVPDHDEYLDRADHDVELTRLLESPLGEELTGFSREELLTVNIVFVGRRPDSVPDR